MKIAVSATGPSLDAEAEPRFGRCPYFIIADAETMEFEAMDNASATAAGGAGISAAQSIADKGVQAVLTGHCGPNAHQVLSAAGIQIITGVSGKVKDAIDAFRSGKLKASEKPNVPDHYGMSAAPGSGSGGGKGRGMGKGCGGGRGRAAHSVPAGQQPIAGLPLEELKSQAQTMAQQLADIQRRIDEMEKE
jgi:predicted Fe-Mo cluster-binding NifX family protein